MSLFCYITERRRSFPLFLHLSSSIIGSSGASRSHYKKWCSNVMRHAPCGLLVPCSESSHVYTGNAEGDAQILVTLKPSHATGSKPRFQDVILSVEPPLEQIEGLPILFHIVQSINTCIWRSFETTTSITYDLF